MALLEFKNPTLIVKFCLILLNVIKMKNCTLFISITWKILSHISFLPLEQWCRPDKKLIHIKAGILGPCWTTRILHLIPCWFTPIALCAYGPKPNSSYQASSILRVEQLKALNLIEEFRKIRMVDIYTYFVYPFCTTVVFLFIFSRGESEAAYHLGLLHG